MTLKNFVGPGRRSSNMDIDMGKILVSISPEEVKSICRNGLYTVREKSLMLSSLTNKRLTHKRRLKVVKLKPKSDTEREELVYRMITRFEKCVDEKDGSMTIHYSNMIPNQTSTSRASVKSMLSRDATTAEIEKVE